MDVERLNEAFHTFTTASKSLEASYGLLQERISYLTSELEIRNRQLSEALADAEQNKDYLRAVLYNIEEALIVIDPEGHVTMMNHSAEELLCLSHGDALGKAFSRLDFSLTTRETDTVLDVRGKRSTVIVSSSDVVDSSGLLRGRVVLIKDITRLRELELQHERNERLIAMGEMAAKIVHEVRNPLCSIELYATMLDRELGDTAHRELARGISTGISSLNTILTNMLYFARPHRASMKHLRLDRVLEESLRMVTPFTESRNIGLTTSLIECDIAGDGELLKQVFLNIIMNAVQAVREQGAIEVLMREQDGSIAVDVKDNGEGIEKENREKIFDPFFSTKDAGTGLGLAIASKIMQSHGGAITVSSAVGKGSTFTLAFPCDKKQPAGAAKKL